MTQDTLFGIRGHGFYHRDNCHDHDQPAAGILTSERGGRILVCRTPGCGDYFATAWAPSMPRLWCERLGGPITHHPSHRGRCHGCEPHPGYDYLATAVYVELLHPADP